MWSFFASNLRDFPYQYDEKDFYADNDSIFMVHQGISKSHEDITIFKYDKTKGSILGYEIAKKAIHKLKTIRHPYILKYVNDFETSSGIYLATERAKPLRSHLRELNLEKIVLEQYLPKGMMDIVKAIVFLNKKAKLKHNNLFAGTVFVTNAGDWKVGDLGFMNEIHDPYPSKPFDSLLRYNPPEVSSKSIAPPCQTADSWGLGVLIWEVYNGGVMKTRADLSTLTNIPANLVEIFCQLIGMPESRIDADKVLDRCICHNGYFENELIYTLEFIEELHLKTPPQKAKFFKILTQRLNNYPKEIVENKILAALHAAVGYGDTSVSIIDPIIKISRQVSEASHYDKLITPCLIKFYQSTDRAIRSKLLQYAPIYIDKMSSDVLNQEIFIHFANGYLDSHPVIRILTVKCIFLLAPYLNHHNLNFELMKHFARLQSKDEKDLVRVYVTEYLGRIAKYIDPFSRPKILMSAFVRALDDPCCRARIAGITALVNTQKFFTIKDIAEKMLPSLCYLTVDSKITVREAAFKAINELVSKLEKVSSNPELKEDMEKFVTWKAKSKVSSNNWGMWAVSAITSRLGATLGLKTSEKMSTNVESKCNKDKDNMSEDTNEMSTEDLEDINALLEWTKVIEENWESGNWSPIEDLDKALEGGRKKEKDINNQKPVTTDPEQKTGQQSKEIKEQKKNKSKNTREQRLTGGNESGGTSVRSPGPLKLGVKKS